MLTWKAVLKDNIEIPQFNEGKENSIRDIIQYNKSIGKNVYVIDVYRSPIERKISAFFEKIGAYHFNNIDSNYTIKNNNLYSKVWQAGTILLPVKSVGVMGDERTYEYTCALRAVTSVDGMTADWGHIPYDLLARISNDIINRVRGINRVVYDISSKPPATIEWE